MKKSNMPEDFSKPIHKSNPKTESGNGCFIYTRVSTERQAEEGYSLDEQEKSCRELAQRIGYKILGVYREEGMSGTNVNRPKFQEMLGKCSDDKGNNVKAVIVIHTDRFARNTLEHLMIKGILLKSRVKLISVLQPMLDDSPEGNLLDIILAGMNEFYSKDLGRKTSRALTQKAQEGWWPGYAPIGYINKTVPETKIKIVATDDKNAPYIKKVFERYATGKYTIDSLNEELYREGFRSKTGKRMRKSSMSALLKNIFYTGKMKIKDQIYQGKHASLIETETFMKVQKILDMHNHKADRTRKHAFLLSNLLFCEECQSRLTGERHVKKSGLIFDYYRCTGPKHEEKDCKQPFVPVKDFEKDIVKIFKKITLASDYMAALKISLERIYQAQNKKDYGWIKSLENKKTAVLKKMDRLEDLLLDDIIDKKRLVEKYSQLKDELASIEDQIKKAKGVGSKKLEKEDIGKILNFIKRLDNIYTSLSPDKKKMFLKTLIAKIFVKEKKISNVVYAPVLQMIIDKDIVRIGTNWLRLLDLIRTLENIERNHPIILHRKLGYKI